MRDHGEVLLVACYELGHQPLNLASPAALLRRAGFAPVMVDTSVEALSDEAIRRARLVAVSVPMHTALRLGVEIARRVRALNPAAHQCAYGLYAALNADHLLGEGLFHSTIGGEFEPALVALAERLAAGKPAAGVPGVATRRAPAAPVLARVPFALPDRAGLPPLRRYAHLLRDGEGEAVPAGYVEATRGCLHLCRHCPVVPVYRGRFFAVPREIVLEDIRRQAGAGAEHITFGDPDFLNGPGHVLRIVRAMRAEHPALTFDATIKVEHILEHRRLFPELAALGLVFVVSAVETVSDHILARLHKGHTRADVDAALAVLDAAGVPMRPSLLPFTPWTSLDDYADLLEWVEARGLVEQIDPVHLSIRLLVPPGSALLDEPETAAWLGALDAEAFTYRWAHPDPRVDRLQAAVAALVEAAERDGRPPAETFARIKALTRAAHGRRPRAATRHADTRPAATSPLPRRRRAPRLTESWFC